MVSARCCPLPVLLPPVGVGLASNSELAALSTDGDPLARAGVLPSGLLGLTARRRRDHSADV